MKSAPVRSLIFDLDGTLVDSLVGIEHSLQAAVAEVLPARAVPRLRIGRPLSVLLREAWPAEPEATLEAVLASFRRHYDGGGYRATALYPAVADTLARLRAEGVRCFVATNKPALATGQVLKHLGLEGHFEAVVSPDSFGTAFPSKAAAVQRLLAEHALEPAATWLVGDSPDDREAALACDLGFVPVCYGYGGLPATPDGVGLRHFAELLRLVFPSDGKS